MQVALVGAFDPAVGFAVAPAAGPVWRWILVAILAAVSTACGSARQMGRGPLGMGPLPVRNQHPAQLTVQHLDPMAAATLSEGAVQLRPTVAYTSLFLADNAGAGNAFFMDGELLRASVQVRIGLVDGLELSSELPMIHTTGGFLDGFLIGYHEVLGLPDQNRANVERDRFLVTGTAAGQEVYGIAREDAMLGDVPIALNWALARPDHHGVGVLLRAGVELPTGDDERGAGNGELDTTFGAAVSLPLSWMDLHGHVQHTLAGTPARSERLGFEFADVTSYGLAAEVPVTDRLAFVLQTEWETSTLRNLPVLAAQREHWLLWLGGRWQLDDSLHLEFSVGEDLRGFVSPDVTFWFGLAWNG